MGAGMKRLLLALALLIALATGIPVAHPLAEPARAQVVQGTWLRLTMNQAQSVPSGPHTTLVWDTVSGKSDDWPDVAAPVTDIVIPSSGLWEVWLRDVDFGDRGPELGSRAVYLRRNLDPYTTRALDIRTDTGVTGRPTVVTAPFVMAFHAGDTLELRVSHTAGVTLQVGAVEVWLYLKEPGAFSFVGVN
jgi:hypothetical protein